MCLEAISAIAKEFVCPITLELPTDPVTAEDGKCYEREAILEWFSKNDGPISPSTNTAMGRQLFPAIQVRNTMEMLVKNGTIDGDLAKAWLQKLADETKVKETRARAEGGDGEAMYSLGVWYECAHNGLAKDAAKARAWYERSAVARNPKGIACLGERLVLGRGGPVDNVRGVMKLTEAAYLGSDVGAYRLGETFIKGLWGLPKDPVQVRFWLKKVIDRECKINHLNDTARARAAGWLLDLIVSGRAGPGTKKTLC